MTTFLTGLLFLKQILPGGLLTGMGIILVVNIFLASWESLEKIFQVEFILFENSLALQVYSYLCHEYEKSNNLANVVNQLF